MVALPILLPYEVLCAEALQECGDRGFGGSSGGVGGGG